VLETANHLYIVMEYASNGDLLEYVNTAGVLSEAEARRLLRQIISAVKVLHEARVVHRDLKLDNILLDEDYNVKLTGKLFLSEPATSNGHLNAYR
jgi:serine/threonine protein kinase